MRVVSAKYVGIFLSCFVLFQQANAQVVINEVHPRPSGGDTDQTFQSMYNSTSTSGAEFIELFNTDPCNAVDISCWTIGGMDGGTNGGAFSFPSGTVIPPLGFITLGGPLTPGLTFNLNDPANTSRLWRSNANRWHLPNGDGWLSLYDATGVSVDAVYWTFSSNDPTKLNNDATFTDGVLQRLAACGGGNLSTASAIPGIEYISTATVTGQSYERSTDGSNTWVLGTATPNDCNGICLTNESFSLNALVVSPDCGQSNGSITFNPSPAGNYTYAWTPNVAFGNQATNLSSGTYTISITMNGCSVDTTIILTATSGITSIVTDLVQPSCNQMDGSVTVSAINGGQAPYEINFNALGFSPVMQYTGLNAGIYPIEISDANGCTYATSVALNQANGPQSVQVSFTDETCGLNNGAVTIQNVLGGSGPYQYNFNGQGFSTQTEYNNLSAGSYTLEVTDANGCVYTAPSINLFNANGPTGITITSSNPTCGESNGSIDLGAVTGGTAPYQYNFNNQGFSSSDSFENLSDGSYLVVVQDANGCQFTAPIILLNSSTGLTNADIIVTDAACEQQNGSIEVTNVTGGTAPYTYSLNGAPSGQNAFFNGLSGGSYTVVITDANGCMLSQSVTVSGGTSPAADFTLNPSVISTISSLFSAIESASQDVVFFEWLVPQSSPSTGNGTIFNGSLEGNEPGNYPVTLIVTNQSGCKDTITKFILLQSDPLVFAPNAFTPDGDEYNNYWMVCISGLDEHSFHLLLFDRWGEVIFESYDPLVGWDGTYHGQLVMDGTYTWTLTIKDVYTDKYNEYFGHINVLR